MADGWVSSLDSEIAAHGACVVRQAIDADTRAELSDLQREADRWIADALAGLPSPAAGCVAGRYTLTPEELGVERFESLVRRICDPVARSACPGAARTMYGGLFLSSPKLPRAQDFHWHTDAFFDGEVDGVTVWVPLVTCGRHAPGIAFADAPLGVSLDAPPKRDGDTFWPAVTDQMVRETIGPIRRPLFYLGDVLVFSDRALHRTHYAPVMRRSRAALTARYAPSGSA